MIETQFSKVIKIFRSNNALEYRWHGNLDLLNQYCSISNTSPKKKKNDEYEWKFCHKSNKRTNFDKFPNLNKGLKIQIRASTMKKSGLILTISSRNVFTNFLLFFRSIGHTYLNKQVERQFRIQTMWQAWA